MTAISSPSGSFCGGMTTLAPRLVARFNVLAPRRRRRCRASPSAALGRRRPNAAVHAARRVGVDGAIAEPFAGVDRSSRTATSRTRLACCGFFARICQCITGWPTVPPLRFSRCHWCQSDLEPIHVVALIAAGEQLRDVGPAALHHLDGGVDATRIDGERRLRVVARPHIGGVESAGCRGADEVRPGSRR